MRRLILTLALLCAAALAQVAPISGRAFDQYGQPIAYAQIRVCSVTSTGIPCTPTVSLYLDYGLTQPTANPYSADQYANYLIYVGALAYPNLYVIQQSADQGLTWSYVEPGPQTYVLPPLGVNTLGGVKGTGTSLLCDSGNFLQGFHPDGSYDCAAEATGVTPAPPLYSLQSNSPLGSFYGDPNLLWYPDSYTNCPSCFLATPTDLSTYGGNFSVVAFGEGGMDMDGYYQGGKISLTANSPFVQNEVQNGPGTITLQSNSNVSGDGPEYGAVSIKADPYNSSSPNTNLANITVETCKSGNTTVGSSCGIYIFANGSSDTADYSGNLTLDAQGNGGPNSGGVEVDGAYIDLWPDTEVHGNLTVDGFFQLEGGTPLTSQSSANPQIVTCPPGGTTGQYCGAEGAWDTVPSGILSMQTAGSGVSPGTARTLYTYTVLANSITAGHGLHVHASALISPNSTPETGYMWLALGGSSLTSGPNFLTSLGNYNYSVDFNFDIYYTSSSTVSAAGVITYQSGSPVTWTALPINDSSESIDWTVNNTLAFQFTTANHGMYPMMFKVEQF